MHPAPLFAWTDQAAMRAFVAATAFAQISIVVDGRPAAAHSPLAWGPDGAIDFHLARANPLTARLDGAAVLATVIGDAGYVSPDWYGSDHQVPTWNYRLVEIEGVARPLDEPGLVALLERLSAAQEDRLAPKPAWTLDKLAPAAIAAMLRGIRGFRIEVEALRGIAKLGQNKSAAERAGAAAGLRGVGNPGLAALMVAR